MELKEATPVFTSSGEQAGRINRVVLDPSTDEVTHIVVAKGWLLPADKVIPVAMIRSATEDRVTLNENSADFDQLPPFEETHFVELTEADLPPARQSIYRYAPVYYWYPPSGYMGYPAFGMQYYGWPPTTTQRNIPAGTIPLKEGAGVMSSDDKHIGNVERVFVDAKSHKATHFLVSKGLFLKEQKLIPAHWVRSVDENKVNLWVSSQLLERLPAYQP